MAIQKANQVLPAEVAQALQLSRANKHVFRANIRTLGQAGWTGTAVANAVGLSRERIRQIMDTDADSLQEPSIAVPEPPEKPEPGRKRATVDISPDILERILELKPVAQSIRFTHKNGRPEAEEYTRLIAQEIERGVSVYQMAKSLGLTPNAIRFRLIRYGYMEPSPTMAKNYPHLVKRIKYRA